MKKVIIIESCEDCPHAIYNGKCGLLSDLDSSVYFRSDLTILDNCPLSNLEDVNVNDSQ